MAEKYSPMIHEEAVQTSPPEQEKQMIWGPDGIPLNIYFTPVTRRPIPRQPPRPKLGERIAMSSLKDKKRRLQYDADSTKEGPDAFDQTSRSIIPLCAHYWGQCKCLVYQSVNEMEAECNQKYDKLEHCVRTLEAAEVPNEADVAAFNEFKMRMQKTKKWETNLWSPKTGKRTNENNFQMPNAHMRSKIVGIEIVGTQAEPMKYTYATISEHFEVCISVVKSIFVKDEGSHYLVKIDLGGFVPFPIDFLRGKESELILSVLTLKAHVPILTVHTGEETKRISKIDLLTLMQGREAAMKGWKDQFSEWIDDLWSRIDSEVLEARCRIHDRVNDLEQRLLMMSTKPIVIEPGCETAL